MQRDVVRGVRLAERRAHRLAVAARDDLGFRIDQRLFAGLSADAAAEEQRQQQELVAQVLGGGWRRWREQQKEFE